MVATTKNRIRRLSTSRRCCASTISIPRPLGSTTDPPSAPGPPGHPGLVRFVRPPAHIECDGPRRSQQPIRNHAGRQGDSTLSAAIPPPPRRVRTDIRAVTASSAGSRPGSGRRARIRISSGRHDEPTSPRADSTACPVFRSRCTNGAPAPYRREPRVPSPPPAGSDRSAACPRDRGVVRQPRPAVHRSTPCSRSHRCD